MREQLISWTKKRFSAEERDEHALWVMRDPKRLAVLWDIFVSEAHPIPQYASWILEKVHDTSPEMLAPYIPALVDHLPQMRHDGERRMGMRMLASSELPEEVWGSLFDIAYNWLSNPNVAIAIRVHAMQTLYNITEYVPELKRELLETIQAHLPDGSAGFKNRGKKLVDKLSKQTGMVPGS